MAKSGKREFVLIAMEHATNFIPKILRACDESFKPGDRVAIEIPQSEIDFCKACLPLVEQGKYVKPDPAILRRLPPEEKVALNNFFFKFALASSPHAALPANLKRKLQKDIAKVKKNTKKFFIWQLVKGFSERGLEPVGIDSYLAIQKLRKMHAREALGRRSSFVVALLGTAALNISLLAGIPAFAAGAAGVAAFEYTPTKGKLIESVLREKRWANRVRKDTRLAGGLFGFAHAKAFKRKLEKEGLQVKRKNVVSLTMRTADLMFAKPRFWLAHARYNARKKRRAKRTRRK